MATALTTNLQMTTVEDHDRLPEAVSKGNFEKLDAYVGATRMTNKSGSQATAGMVVIGDTTADNAFTTTATASHEKVVGVVQETIANAAAGIVKQHGSSLVKVTGATSRGDWLTTSTTAGSATPSSATSAPVGTFAIAMTATVGVGTVTAVILVTATGSAFNYAKGSDLTSAAALVLGTGSYFDVTGVVTITSMGTRTVGDIIALQFDSQLQLTYNATTLILLDGANHLTIPGEVMTFISEGSGNWRQIGTSMDPQDQLRWRTMFTADTGFWKAGVQLEHVPNIADGFASIMAGQHPAGGGLSIVGSGGTEGIRIPVTVNDLTKGCVNLYQPTLNADLVLAAHVGLDLNTDDFDISCVILLDNDAAREVFFGFHANQQAVGTTNSILGFRVTNNGNIIGVSDNAATETTRDSGLAGAAAPGTRYILRITGAAGTIKFYVNNAQVGADVTTNIPPAGACPYFVLGLRAGSNASHLLGVRSIFGKWKAN